REEEAIAAAVVQRLYLQRDGLDEEERRATALIDALRGRITQMAHDIEREGGLNRDAGETIERLEREAAELSEAADGHEDRLVAAAEAAHEAASVLQVREEDLSQQTEDMARLSARHASAQRLLEDNRKTLVRAEQEAGKAREAVAQSEATLARAGEEFAAAEVKAREAEELATRADTALADAESARAEAQAREADARARRSEAEGETNALRAETAALAKLVARDTVEGGQILDAVQVHEGYEKALGAALADDLRAPQVESDAASGWATLSDYPQPQALPAGVKPLSLFVIVPGVLRRRIEQIGLVEPDEGPALQAALKPGQRLVSSDGDLWRWDGFRAGAEDAPSAAALRLQQLNRLETLKQSLEEATRKAEGASAAHEHLGRQLADLSRADAAAREARRTADRLVADAGRALSRAEAERNLAAGRLDSLGLAVSRHEDEAMNARTRATEAEVALGDLADLDEARTLLENVRTTVEASRITMMSRRSAHDELRREGEARKKRAQEVDTEIGNWRHRLDTAEKRSAELAARKTATEEELKQAEATPSEIAAQRSEVLDAIARAESRKVESRDALSKAEADLRDTTAQERDAERQASEAREARARAETRSETTRATVAQAAERIADESRLTPAQLLGQLDVRPDDMPAAETLEADVGRLKRQRDALGAVNLRAEEDARAVQEEHDTLSREKTDLEDAIKTLRGGIASLNREGRERLLTAFEQVNSNFSMLFKHLFGGGEANLVMVESVDPLEAGLEIMCQPPGKKLSTLSLLSGGEQTLTALAIIFAVFLANPAPICVLDEVDAPLDDANVGRFCDLLDEMCRRTGTRFLIITHHAVTMARMDRLFGVTMAEQGVSQLVSVDLGQAETLVA
ncbi:MAG: chromosome segregation protein SMC, partial [Pseudomonadota bacterium]